MPDTKRSYQSPEIVDLGTVEATTTGSDAPVRDPQSDPMTYFNSAPNGRLPLDGQDDEVDLGGR